ncbi:hypothetical protein KDL01_01160 [Actinospica durhamensis]|uniref:Uncharacterized protein n=1 Tax=Actinospica durhamensis TaxID=1508375 RepID=A0A941EJV1_9ACTN|nr:DUF6461 domain-containing protein [Actinospica durhamensis]MBR7831847.1 hypothetical protein [Actinospica durhamensis]
MEGNPDAAVDELAAAVALVMPGLVGVIPPRPAAALGRLGRSVEVSSLAAAGAGRPEERVTGPQLKPHRLTADQGGGPAVLAALASLEVMLAERLLGALEVAVEALDVAAFEVAGLDVAAFNVAGPTALAGQAPRTHGTVVAFVSSSDESEARRAATFVEKLRPGTAALVETVTRMLVAHESIAPLLATVSGEDERSLASAHGAGYLAFAVATVSAVIKSADLPAYAGGPSAVIGLALGASAMLLREVEMPPGYTEAVLAEARARFLLPRHTHGSVSLAEGRGFALTDGAWPETSDFSGNGLVAVGSSGVVIQTGAAAGAVRVDLAIREGAPEEVDTKTWDEVVEVSWNAARGLASVVGSGEGESDARLKAQTPPWPGHYRLRVHVSGRDGDRDEERYKLVVWRAPAAPEIVHRAVDRLGHRLRGEPEPSTVVRPEAAYRWISGSFLREAATVTIATGVTPEELIRIFGGDPDRPEPTASISHEQHEDRNKLIASIAVLDIGGGVLAVEDNGFQGADSEIVRKLSRQGRAASMYWNVNALTCLTLAEGGRLLESFEPGFAGYESDHPATVEALRGIDFEDYRDKHEKGLVAVERFTGHVFTEEALERITSQDVVYRLPN